MEYKNKEQLRLNKINKNFMWWMALAMFKVKIILQDKGNCLIQKPAVCLIKILAHKWYVASSYLMEALNN